MQKTGITSAKLKLKQHIRPGEKECAFNPKIR